MARPRPRLEPGAFVHVIHRGVRQGALFADDIDRRLFLRALARAAARHDVSLIAWALMTNHTHLLVRRGSAPIDGFVFALAHRFARFVNHRHRRTGHVFQGRSRQIPIRDDDQLLTCIRYVHLNPVCAGVVDGIDALDEYLWTGHRALMGGAALPCQDVGLVLSLFAGAPGGPAAGLRRFLVAGIELEQELWGEPEVWREQG